MLLHLNNRFYVAGISFLFPEKVFLNTNPPYSGDHTLYLISSDQSFTIEIIAHSGKKNSKDDLTPIPGNPLYTFHTPITPFFNNGLSGHYCCFHTVNPFPVFLETAFDIPQNNDGLHVLSIQFSADNYQTLQSSEFLAVANSLLRSVRLETDTV